MRKIIFLVILLLLTNCKSETTSSEELFFNPEDLTSLSIEDINDFWQGDSIWQEDKPNNFFKVYDGYLKGIEYRSEYNKLISVHVFESKEIAINAMEEFRLVISAMTSESEDHEIIKEKWWYIKGAQYLTIYINKLNTLVWVSNRESADQNISINTAVKILNRIESRSK